MSAYAILNDYCRTLFAPHGHLWNPGTLPNSSENCIFLSGHTHIHEIYKKGNLLICNPGSITLPKNGNNPTFAVYDNGDIKLIDITLL